MTICLSRSRVRALRASSEFIDEATLGTFSRYLTQNQYNQCYILLKITEILLKTALEAHRVGHCQGQAMMVRFDLSGTKLTNKFHNNRRLLVNYQ